MASLTEIVHQVDLAVTAAGLTAYELACAGVPQVAVGIADNQRRVLEGLRGARVARCVDLAAGEGSDAVAVALEALRDHDVRRSLSGVGRSIFDGGGADRAAQGLLERWGTPRRD